MRTGLLLIILFGFVSGCSQTETGPKWSDFESKDGGIRASLLCTPKERIKSFQDQPRPIHIYSYECESNGIRFLLSVKNHQNDFNAKTIDESFESNEFLLKSMFGEVEKFSARKDFTTNGFASRDYDMELKAGGKVRALIGVNEFATYEALIGVTQDNLEIIVQKKLDFKSISDKFIGSVEILKK